MSELPAVEKYIEQEGHREECFWCGGDGYNDIAPLVRYRVRDDGIPNSIVAPAVDGGVSHIWHVDRELGRWRGNGCWHTRGRQPRPDLDGGGPCAECHKESNRS